MSKYGAMVEYWQGIQKDSEKKLSQCNVVLYKSHMDCPWSEPGLPL
jgi:hypothetical protein